MANIVCDFSKIFRRNMSPDLPESFLLLKLLKINLAEKKTTLEKVTKFDAPSPKTNSEYASDMKHYQKAYLRAVSVLNVFVFS